MNEFVEIFKSLKEMFSFIWTKPTNEHDKKLRTYNWILLFLIGFMVAYGTWFYVKQQKTQLFSKPEITEIRYITYVPDNNTKTFASHFTARAIPVLSTNTTLPIIISQTNAVNQFYCGEIVEIKSFGMYGIVHEKIFGVYGYTYIVRYKDNTHTLHDVECSTDELIRPPLGSLPVSALLN